LGRKKKVAFWSEKKGPGVTWGGSGEELVLRIKKETRGGTGERAPL